MHRFLATPERLNRNIPAVINETKAAIAATDTDARLRHGAAALGAGSSVVLDVTVIAGLAKSAATATVERELAQASVDVASAPVTNGAPVRAKPDYTNPQVVEAQVRQNAANALARAQRQGLRAPPEATLQTLRSTGRTQRLRSGCRTRVVLLALRYSQRVAPRNCPCRLGRAAPTQRARETRRYHFR